MKKLTMLISALTISINLISAQPAKRVEIKVEPISAITNGVAILGIESGYKNLGFGLDFAMLFGNGKFGYLNPELSMIYAMGMVESSDKDISQNLLPPFRYSGYSFDFNILYYLNENRKNGFSLISGLTLEAGNDFLYDTTNQKYNYTKGTDTIYRLYLKMGIGHKIEIKDLFSISNSIELPLLIYDSTISDKAKDKENKEQAEKNIYRAFNASRLLSNFRVKFLEFRFAF